MPVLEIGPAGQFGLIKGPPPAELPPEAWTAGKNIRIVDGSIQRSEGHASVFGTALGAAHFIMPVPTVSRYFWMYGSTQKMYVTDMLNHYDITRASGGDYTAPIASWTGGVLGGIPIVSNGHDEPQMWAPADVGTKLTALSNWPAGFKANILRPFKTILVAADIIDGSGNRNPHEIRFSHPADPGAVPSSWDYTDATKLAGRTQIAEGGDFIIDMYPLGEINVIYKGNAAFGMRYIGLPDLFAFPKIMGMNGILTRRCVQEVLKRHVVVTQGDIIIHDGQNVQGLLNQKQQKSLFTDIDPTYFDRSFTFVIPKKREFHFVYPAIGSSIPNTDFIWNWDTKTFAHREFDAYAVGVGVVDPGTADMVVDDIHILIDDYHRIVDSRLFNPAIVNALILKGSSAGFNLMDSGFDFAGTPFTSFVERTGLSIYGRDRQGNWKADEKVVKMINAVWPRVKSTQPINVYVGRQDTFNSPITWTGPRSFNPNTDKWVDFDVTGPLIGIRFEFPNSTDVEFNGYGLDVRPIGRY